VVPAFCMLGVVDANPRGTFLILEPVGVTVMQVAMMRDTPVATAQRERVTTSDIAGPQSLARPAWTLACGCHRAVRPLRMTLTAPGGTDNTRVPVNGPAM